MSRSLSKYGVYLLCIFFTIWYIFPFYWTGITSFKPRVYVYDPSKWIFKPSLSGYFDVLFKTELLNRMANSTFVSVIATLSSLLIGTLAAYSLVRIQLRFNQTLLRLFIVVRFLPPISLVFPWFIVGNVLHIIDTPWILILAYQLLGITFTVLMMSGFFRRVPIELEEAALIDGCTRLKAFFRITLPLCAGGLFATGIFVFLYTWNEFTYAIFLTFFRSRTWPTILSMFVGIRGVEWGPMTASAMLGATPVLIAALLLRRYIIQGLTFGILEGGK